MSFMSLSSGHTLSLREPRPAEINIFAIAWGLAQINRFVGQAIRPYSVAEHSLLVCEIMEREMVADVHALLAGLMHDAHEFVTNDVSSPFKEEVGPAWHAAELRWQRHVQVNFALITASAAWAKAVKLADLRALATERRDLMRTAEGAPEWPVLRGVEPVDWVDLNTPERRAHDWEFWRDRFLDKFHELEYARNLLLDAQRSAVARNGV